MENNNEQSRILYSCFSNINKEGERLIRDHVLSIILTGSQIVYLGDKTYEFNAGDIRFFRKNQLSKFIKLSLPDGEFKSLTVQMDKETLQQFSINHKLYMDSSYKGENLLLLRPNELLNKYFDSLSPYIDGAGCSNDMLTELKVNEAIMILLQTNPELKNLLFDFSDPGKIDLETFMNRNYKFNANISQFAYLSGRSLASFKRDFERIFNSSPNRWIQKQRLKDAYVLIKEKGHKVSDVYMDVGFNDLSHFSFAFKKEYGTAPTKV
ncbi:helix-turn-helix domain-containing protein [Mucilaginibacter sp. E4BP6]|uniref:helix-turn-helix domain-containing protein n=1 Tax=Mucilaginibacter sp. E4BP6 TaxID=2723089 RepID=UPI0017BAD4D8|nr:AraC family transcriptional regulator [Mucilaginibacter sp. E4BP6]NYE64933.1 AraC-like DNA-binding protein [Mucilaginibacter sp. E4BP6]